ncbi:NAD(P)-dependent dehydrogenase, short-chain alcohol dehydrogenase family [Sphingobium faniae]|nr:NAD(P)-dependent dehydrogenase, short-chain alcohol dehydrogenase family [Sphingobium faniae]
MLKQFDHGSTGAEVLEGQDLTGKRVVITGASVGLGAETARLLAQVGAETVLGVRDVAAGEKVAEKIARETGRAPQVLHLDLASLASVRDFAARLGDQPIHVLINNAGVMATPFGKTADGFETQIGVNHFGHFLLTKLLMPALLKGAPSRVVQLSSAGHIWSGVDFDDMHFERRPYDPWISYGQSKSANVLFAVELTRRYGSQGVIANAVMPGRIGETGLGRYATDATRQSIPTMSAAAPTAGSPVNNLPKTLAQGVATTIWAVVAPQFATEGGYYLEDCQIAAPWSEENPRRGVKDYALDAAAATRLWDISEAAVAAR